MSDFQELIKSFAKSREYVRDFFVYGFKTRDDFTNYSRRTYDDERRRIESWLFGYVRQDYTEKGKNISLAIDSNLLDTNPLYRVWKAKSFTDNDIMLHFFILDVLTGPDGMTADRIADEILKNHGVLFDVQLVRRKCNEYVREGLLSKTKDGKKLLYARSDSFLSLVQKYPPLLDAVKFYQLTSPLGIIGSTLLDAADETNDFFRVKHNFFVHTLEDEILLPLLDAIHTRHCVTLTLQSTKGSHIQTFSCVPLQIFISTRTGRRFLCLYREKSRRFGSARMDAIKNVKIEQPCEAFGELLEKLDGCKSKLWGISFDSKDRQYIEHLKLTLHINEEREEYILTRIRQEGKNGTLTRLGKDTFLYEKDVFDANEILPWIRTFTGRILSIECTSQKIKSLFQSDMQKMYELYLDS